MTPPLQSDLSPRSPAGGTADRSGSFPQRLVIAALRGYQLALSPMFPGSCRFVPSCSTYATEAVRRFGVLRGGWLTLRRLSRCRPLAAHGFDPIPDARPHD